MKKSTNQISAKIAELEDRLKEIKRQDKALATKIKSNPDNLNMWNRGFVPSKYSEDYLQIGDELIRIQTYINQLKLVQK